MSAAKKNDLPVMTSSLNVLLWAAGSGRHNNKETVIVSTAGGSNSYWSNVNQKLQL